MSPARSFDALDDGKQETQTTVAALRLLPLMIGWFAMNAPSGLGLYWVFNNILTTTQVASASVVLFHILLRTPSESDALTVECTRRRPHLSHRP